jgi:hypothetical protein
VYEAPYDDDATSAGDDGQVHGRSPQGPSPEHGIRYSRLTECKELQLWVFRMFG